MAAAIGEQSFTQRSSIRRDYSDVSLPCIVGRLTKLEAEGSSYDELLHDFASRRRVAPVKERRSVNKVADPAQETDEIVQVRSRSYPLVGGVNSSMIFLVHSFGDMMVTLRSCDGCVVNLGDGNVHFHRNHCRKRLACVFHITQAEKASAYRTVVLCVHGPANVTQATTKTGEALHLELAR